VSDRETEQKFSELLNVMAQLRSDSGCPWDREQTHLSLKPCLIEETYELLEALDDLAAVVSRLPFKVNLRTAQNIAYRLLQTHFPEMKQRAEKADQAASRWVERFISLCGRISVRVGGNDE